MWNAILLKQRLYFYSNMVCVLHNHTDIQRTLCELCRKATPVKCKSSETLGEGWWFNSSSSYFYEYKCLFVLHKGYLTSSSQPLLMQRKSKVIKWSLRVLILKWGRQFVDDEGYRMLESVAKSGWEICPRASVSRNRQRLICWKGSRKGCWQQERGP